jgi:hypothetical protein
VIVLACPNAGASAHCTSAAPIPPKKSIEWETSFWCSSVLEEPGGSIMSLIIIPFHQPSPPLYPNVYFILFIY